MNRRESENRDLFAIADLAREFGISTRAIRFYETKGLLTPERVGSTRVFRRRDRARLILILRGKRLGFSLRDISDYLSLYDADRTELIREELSPAGTVIDGTQELISEYAVDLRFRITVQPNPLNPLTQVEDANLYTWAGTQAQRVAGRGPQFIRSIHSWLSVRSRAADRNSTISVASGPLYRIALGAAGAGPYARVRTVQSRVALNNQ